MSLFIAHQTRAGPCTSYREVMEPADLANALRALASGKQVNLITVANALEKHANEGNR